MLQLAAVALANHAAQPAPQLYWNSVLPNTQMPRAISELLHPAKPDVENHHWASGSSPLAQGFITCKNIHE
ncbi:hypothetical protein Pyn_16617 [Prunus yedoensis var. nudiflora]|uniref:Uncharacterized protein n=1 Tax=Prunus yedoensis var. nudiflora TaxID=2094558 RepID=A0A314U8J8_PRUYE|nr:hypothetical protein Pyn_16617 [Prunus yedoensis var. nudiflora]